MESYSDAYALEEESLTVRERLAREAINGENGNENGNGREGWDAPISFNGNTNGLTTAQVAVAEARSESLGKRVTDLVLGVTGFLVFLFLLPFIALGIKLSSRGPVIYRQRRTGLNGREFTCLKFRTMHQVKLRRIDGKPVVTQKGDKRIFAFGQFIRRTNLDELPQIINVLKGEMSLVGPRPYPVNECTYWNSQFDDFYYRYLVKPGISGLAQSRGYRGGTLNEEHMRKRLDYDLIYVEKKSALLDLKIIWKTVLQMLHLDTNAH